jgi:GT2 family glycosyltransferase
MIVASIAKYIWHRMDSRRVSLRSAYSFVNHHGTRTLEPSVTIIIPTRDNLELLRTCVESIISQTDYTNYSITVVDNQSSCAETIGYLNSLSSDSVQVLDYPFKFNYSAINNFAVGRTSSDYVCFLNNDTEIIDPLWLKRLMDHAVQPNAGIVGSKLLYKTGEIQHLGIALGYRGLAGHPYRGESPLDPSSESDLACFRVSAVTLACALISRTNFFQLQGLDEDYRVGLNDVDLGIRATQLGLVNALCTETSTVHHESKSRRSMRSFRGAAQAAKEIISFLRQHNNYPWRDPFFRR